MLSTRRLSFFESLEVDACDIFDTLQPSWTDPKGDVSIQTRASMAANIIPVRGISL